MLVAQVLLEAKEVDVELIDIFKMHYLLEYIHYAPTLTFPST